MTYDGATSVKRNRATITFDFDRVRDWGPALAAYLSDRIPSTAGATILRQKPEYIEDAADILFANICSDKAELVSSVSAWIKSQTVAAYHGSRLADKDIKDIERRGLAVLAAVDRKKHLREKLSRHPCWWRITKSA